MEGKIQTSSIPDEIFLYSIKSTTMINAQPDEPSSFPQLTDKNSGKIWPLQKRITTIGSDEQSSIRLSGGSLPKRICHIMFQQGRYILSPLSGSIDIKINSKIIRDTHIFMHGDTLSIDTHEFVFYAYYSGESAHAGKASENVAQNPLHELIHAIVSLLHNRDKDVYTDLVASISRLLKSDAARLVFDDTTAGVRQTVAKYPHDSSLDRFSNSAIDWAKNASKTILASEDHWADPSQSITRNKVASILCAPLREGTTVIGFLYLDRLHNREPFTEEDRTLCDALIPLFSEIISYHSEHLRQQITIEQYQRQQLVKSHGMIYSSTAMKELISQAERYAKTDSPVLLLGETGTGKELLARLLHEKSARHAKPFKAINCGAIPETLIESELFGYEKGAFTGAASRKTGLLEAANGGTVFFDEIGDLPLQMQVKLLRAIQENEITRLGGHDSVNIDIRLITATNRNLDNDVNNGKFRQDLFFRINVLLLKLPPLRDRDKDIILLADYFNTKYCQQFGLQLKLITGSAQSKLTSYNYPGNVRELENIIQKAILNSPDNKITEKHIDISSSGPLITLKEARAVAERELISTTLSKTGGNISMSAKLLDIDRKWLMKIMVDLGIDADDYRG